MQSAQPLIDALEKISEVVNQGDNTTSWQAEVYNIAELALEEWEAQGGGQVTRRE